MSKYVKFLKADTTKEERANPRAARRHGFCARVNASRTSITAPSFAPMNPPFGRTESLFEQSFSDSFRRFTSLLRVWDYVYGRGAKIED